MAIFQQLTSGSRLQTVQELLAIDPLSGCSLFADIPVVQLQSTVPHFMSHPATRRDSTTAPPLTTFLTGQSVVYQWLE